MDGDFIPVVVEGACDSSCISTLKFKAPANMTMLQLFEKIRARLKSPIAVHLMLEKGFTVLMSQSVGLVHRDNKSESGLLHLSCMTENVFGCIPPRQKPIKRMFPGQQEALPFGAPEPFFGLYDFDDEDFEDDSQIGQNLQYLEFPWETTPEQGAPETLSGSPSGFNFDLFTVLDEAFGFNTLENSDGEVILSIPYHSSHSPAQSDIVLLDLTNDQVTEVPSDKELEEEMLEPLYDKSILEREIEITDTDLEFSSDLEEEDL